MKNNLKSFKINATIPCGQYANIQPSIEIENTTLLEGEKIAMPYILKLFEQYGSIGGLEKSNAITVKLKSFNEDIEVDFEPVSHTYTYNGKKLSGASGLTASFYKPFDAVKISEACGKAWEQDPADIQGLWKSNGDVVSLFGTAVHKALEHSFEFGDLGVSISKKKKDGSNPAIIKHPYIWGIVDDFKGLYASLKFKGEVVTEAFISDVENGFCGQADRVLITGKKKCRIQDYKVNVEAEVESPKMKALKPFDTLPKNKITKYQIQMSIYANMLQKSGWEVEGLDVFVLDDGWKHHSLEVLQVIK